MFDDDSNRGLIELDERVCVNCRHVVLDAKVDVIVRRDREQRKRVRERLVADVRNLSVSPTTILQRPYVYVSCTDLTSESIKP